jgi:hypothetical protein
MKKIMLMVVATLLVLISPDIDACEPCFKTLSLEETIQQADLIIVGEKTANGPSVGMDHYPDASDWIEIRIFDILKGQEEEEYIRVNSWNGMCGYGIVIAEGKYVIFLEQRKDDREVYQYDAVNNGCSIKIYPMEGEIVVLEDERISVEEFVGKLKKVLTKE